MRVFLFIAATLSSFAWAGGNIPFMFHPMPFIAAALSSFGTGADGSPTFAANTNLSTTNTGSRSCVDGGDAVEYSVSSITSNSATLTAAPSTGCLNANDEVLLISLQGTSTEYTNVGNYETFIVSSVSGSTVTFATTKTKYYGSGASDDLNIGTGLTNQKVMLMRVPNYTNVTVNSGVTLTANAWNGTLGGVLFFRAKGTVTVNGVISMDQTGFAGGVSAGNGPEDYKGYTTVGGGTGGTGGTFAGGAGAGSPTTGGGKGAAVGGGFCGTGAGGAGYIGGGGGGGNASSCAASGGGGGGGAPYTISQVASPNDLTKLMLGGGASAGAGGGVKTGGSANGGSSGSAGGGIIIIAGDTLNFSVANAVTSSGGNGGAGSMGRDIPTADGGGGGGGGGGQGASGGSIRFIANNVTFATNSVKALGGNGGNGGAGGRGGSTGGTGAGGAAGTGATFVNGNETGGSGGNGGSALNGGGGGGGKGGSAGYYGKIAVYYSTSLTGTTSPSAYTSNGTLPY